MYKTGLQILQIYKHQIRCMHLNSLQQSHIIYIFQHTYVITYLLIIQNMFKNMDLQGQACLEVQKQYSNTIVWQLTITYININKNIVPKFNLNWHNLKLNLDPK